MSISNLQTPNGYDLYTRSLTSGTIVTPNMTVTNVTATTATVPTINTTTLTATNIVTDGINITETALPTFNIFTNSGLDTGKDQTLKRAYNGLQVIYYDAEVVNIPIPGGVPINRFQLRLNGSNQLNISDLGLKQPRGVNNTTYYFPISMKIGGTDALGLFSIKKISSTVIEISYSNVNITTDFSNLSTSNDIRAFTISYPVQE